MDTYICVLGYPPIGDLDFVYARTSSQRLWRAFCTKIICIVVRERYPPDLSIDYYLSKKHHVR